MLYPASRKTLPAFGISGESGLPSEVPSTLVTTCVRCGSRPVSRLDRAAEHCGVLQKAEVKRAAPRSRRRRFGNSAGPGSRADSWSVMKTSTLRGLRWSSARPTELKSCLRVQTIVTIVNEKRKGVFQESMDNPFQDPLRFERHVPECVMVIFGANGDLTKRKLVPALYRLAYDRRLPPGFGVIGISRTPMTDDEFRERMRGAAEEFLGKDALDADVW